MECEPTPLHGGAPHGAVADVIDSVRLEGSLRLEDSLRLEVEQSLERRAVSANISAAAFCAAAGMFCQAVLKLQQQGSSGPRECLLVQEVLPSFSVALSTCCFPVSALATERASWREQAGRLNRLAASLLFRSCVGSRDKYTRTARHSVGHRDTAADSVNSARSRKYEVRGPTLVRADGTDHKTPLHAADKDSGARVPSRWKPA